MCSECNNQTHSLSELTAVILAGGLGTRLRSVVADRPKVLAEIHGRPFLLYLLDQLAVAGVNSVVLCSGFLGEQIEELFGNSYGSMSLLFSHETSPLGTGGALRCALPLLESETLLVMNGDSFCHVDFSAFYTRHYEHDAEATILLTEVPDTSRYGQIRLHADGSVLSFEEKGGRRERGWINAGLYFLSRQLLLTIPEKRFVSLEKEIFPAWIERRFYGYQTQGAFLDIGTPESYAAAHQFFASDKTL